LTIHTRYDPQFYDTFNAGAFRGDIDWYRRKARECGGRVLELGGGTGRITLPVARDGVSIWALDLDDAMIDELMRKTSLEPADVRQRITIVKGDMRSFRIDVAFALVMIPFRAFLHNVTADDQLACLRCARAHLSGGGRIAFNVFHPSLEYMAQHVAALAGVWRWRESRELPDGTLLMRSEANRYDTVRQRVHSQHRYEVYDIDGTLTRTVVHSLELAYLYPGDVRSLLEKSGFTDVVIKGGFGDEPFASDTDELVIEATAGLR
jgi:2-polyprenyl-3-methyl-5-hydroxy-6-metoxy-1,4-benzoquinol methylase